MNIGQAVEAMKQGKRVRCQEWSGTKKFIFMQVPSVISKEIVPKMQSLPQSVKDYFQSTFDSPTENISEITYANQIVIVSASNLIESYSPTCADILSDWWEILD